MTKVERKEEKCWVRSRFEPETCYTTTEKTQIPPAPPDLDKLELPKQRLYR